MRQKDNTFLLLIIFMILGIAVAVQARSTLNTNIEKESAVVGIEDLKAQLTEELNIGKNLKQEINVLEKENEAYLKAAVDNKNDDYLKGLKDSLDYMKLKAGLTDVKGSGLTIKLDDAPVRKNVNPNLLIIHDTDIVRILNELKKAGAQAMSINDERIIATSEQVCAGPTIKINNSRYAVPYVINAIGNPDTMYDAVSKSDTVALMLRDNIKVEISKAKSITVPKLSVNNIDSLISGLEVFGK